MGKKDERRFAPPGSEEVHVSHEIEEKAPLFIKVEKYRDVLKNIHQMRSYYVGMSDALEALSEIVDELKSGISIVQNMLKTVNSKLTDLNAKFSKPHTTEHVEIGKITMDEKDIEKVEKYVQDVHRHLKELETKIKSLSK